MELIPGYWAPMLLSAVLSSCGETSSTLSKPGNGKLGDQTGEFPSTCPTDDRDSRAGKVRHEAFLRQHADAIHSVSVTLTKPDYPAISCEGSTDPACNVALMRSMDENVRAVGCILDSIDDGERRSVTAVWYAPPAFDSKGRTVPIGTAFRTDLALEPIEKLASNPLVATIEPAPGEGAGLTSATDIPADCPIELEAPEPKLVDASALRGSRR